MRNYKHAFSLDTQHAAQFFAEPDCSTTLLQHTYNQPTAKQTKASIMSNLNSLGELLL